MRLPQEPSGTRIVSALATVAGDGSGLDWILRVEESGGKTSEMLQSVIIQNDDELPTWMEDFWNEVAVDPGVKAGDVVKRTSDRTSTGRCTVLD